jgi:hypothetical protein
MTTIAQKQARLKELDSLISTLRQEEDALEAELHNSTAEIGDIILESNISVNSYLRMLLHQLIRKGPLFNPEAPFGKDGWWFDLLYPVSLAKGVTLQEAAIMVAEYGIQGFCEEELPC